MKRNEKYEQNDCVLVTYEKYVGKRFIGSAFVTDGFLRYHNQPPSFQRELPITSFKSFMAQETFASFLVLNLKEGIPWYFKMDHKGKHASMWASFLFNLLKLNVVGLPGAIPSRNYQKAIFSEDPHLYSE